MSSRNLVLAIYLALQVMAMPCMPCQCGVAEREQGGCELVLSSLGDDSDNTAARCSNCEAQGRIQPILRVDKRDRQIRPLVVTTQRLSLLHDGPVAFRAAVDGDLSLTAPDVHESRVLLE